jgi:hypothetical protein
MEMEEEDHLFANYYLNRWTLRPCRNSRYWVKPLIYRREQLDQYDTLMRELREDDPEACINYMRLPMELQMYTMKSWVEPHPASPNKKPGGGKPLIQD